MTISFLIIFVLSMYVFGSTFAGAVFVASLVTFVIHDLLHYILDRRER